MPSVCTFGWTHAVTDPGPGGIIRKPSFRFRIGRYLKGTLDKGLIMSPSSKPYIDCYPDAGFAGLYGHEKVQDLHCVHSPTGFVILALGCPVPRAMA